MPSYLSTFVSAAAFALVFAHAEVASAQACCAGSSAVTPARLGLHDDALVGVMLRSSAQVGTYAYDGTYVPAPSGAAERDFTQDLFGAVRVLRRGQLGALVPFVETYRRSGRRSEFGGGLGDVNLSARYDFILARESQYVPGIGLLLGATLPTGTPAESAKEPLATDATGIGAVQANGGVSLEQMFGRWIVGVSGIVAVRAPRSVGPTRMTLAPEFKALASVAYVFASGASLATALSYTMEGDASANGVAVPDSGRRVPIASLAGSLPLTDALRLTGSLFASPPLSSLGKNQLVNVGITAGITYSVL